MKTIYRFFRLHLLRFDRQLSLLSLTLQKARKPLLGFSLLFCFIFMAFTSLFYLLYHTYFYEFSTLFRSAQTCFEMIALEFNAAKSLQNIDSLVTAICLLLFVIIIVCFLVNMFISIIVDHFNSIRRDMNTVNNNNDLRKFIKNKLHHLFSKC